MAERSATPPPASPAKASIPKGHAEIKVSLLDGTEVTLDVERKVKAADVIERVHTDVDTGERDFFSLFFYDNNQKIFLDPLKTVKEQIPNDKQMPWRLSFGVKFYVPDPASMKEDYSRYLYCLQLCQDIRENRVLIDRETATRLTALMLQGSVGDYDPESHKEGYTEEFQDFLLIPKSVQPENYESQLMELHKSKAGYSPAQAEGEFLQIAKKLPRYGMHLFAAQDEHHTLVLIGNSYRGVSIYRDQTEVFQFPWANIVKISYHRRKFRIKYRPTANANDRRAVAMMKLFCGEPPAAKKVWKNAVEQHTFFRLTEPDSPSRVQNLFRRGSKFRYSGRTLKQAQQTKPERQEPTFTRSHSERLQRKPYQSYAPGFVPLRDSFRPRKTNEPPPRNYIIGKQQPKDDEKWVILDRPPQDEPVDKTRFEQQRVKVDFRASDGLPEETHKYVIRRNEGGYEMHNTSPTQPQEPSYRLSVVDVESQTATTVVSLNIEPSGHSSVSHRGEATTIFDSTRLPVVKLHNASVTTTTVMESSGKTVSSGGVSQLYPVEDDIADELGRLDALMGAGPAVNGSEEAEQVRMFLEKEHEVMERAFAQSDVPPQIAVH